MRTKYRHLVPLSAADRDQIWATATLTVDANVLLDLYRLHESTQRKLLAALQQFTGRTWLSHQAAEEFWRHRHGVISNANADFDSADVELRRLSEAAGRLKAFRLIPRALISDLEASLRTAVEAATEHLGKARADLPDYSRQDPILDLVLDLFEGRVGDGPSDEEATLRTAEAERRRAAKIPPGYMDGDKDANASGDYFLWAEVLAKAAEGERPTILVTSEKKDDWWERQRGRRVGPRRELLTEAAKVTRRPILIYETEHFLTVAAERVGEKVATSIVADIRAVELQRASHAATADTDPETIVHEAVEALAFKLTNSDELITGLIAQTNASDFYPDEIEVLHVGRLALDEVTMAFRCRVHFAGDQDEERPFHGDGIVAMVAGHVSYDGSDWYVADYDITAEMERARDEYDPDEAYDAIPDDEPDRGR